MLSGIFALLSNILFFTGYVNLNNSFEKPLDKETELALLKRIENGDKKAVDILARHNLRLVVHVVKKYALYNDNDELISAGNIGLVKAINTFRISKGTQFSTYASKCIDNEILMYIRANKKYKETKSLYEPISYDKEGNDSILLDVMGDDENSLFDQVRKNELQSKMSDILKKSLSKMEYEILTLRYGLNGSNVYTQKEVAKKFNISRSYVSRLETKSLVKIREYLLQNNINLL